MALIKFGMMMTDARGKLGGQVFTKARNGSTVRTKVTPSNPRSAAQQKARGLLASLSRQWATLTEVQRLAWSNAVSSYPKTNIFGDNYLTTGKSLFIGVNTNISNVGGTNILVPPVLVEMPNPINIICDLDETAGQLTVTPDDAVTGVDNMYYLEATAPSSPGISNFSGAYRFYNFENAAASDPDQNYIEYSNKFGAPVIGKKVGFRVRIINKVTGQVTIPYVSDGIVF